MIGTIVWLIGLVCAIWCVLDIFKKNISTGGKVIAAVVVLLQCWGLRSTTYSATICRSGSNNRPVQAKTCGGPFHKVRRFSYSDANNRFVLHTKNGDSRPQAQNRAGRQTAILRLLKPGS